jgi:hypothetical protein
MEAQGRYYILQVKENELSKYEEMKILKYKEPECEDEITFNS